MSAAESELDLSLAGDGSLLPLRLLLQQAAASPHAATCRLPAWPDGAAGLPEILALAGIRRLLLPDRAAWPSSWWWRGASGGRVAVGTPGATAPLHAAGLPPGAWSGSSGWACWSEEDRLRRSEAGWRPARSDGEVWQVWNPLPFARRGLAILDPGEDPPTGGLVDGAGRRSPLQPAPEGVLALLELPALGSLDCRAAPDPGPIAAWTVSPRALDNGRLRAEFDRSGRIVRLCIDGRFLDPIDPLVALAVDGEGPVMDEPTPVVLEGGPLRAAVRFEHRLPAGVLRVTYRLVAEAGWLEVLVEAVDRPRALLRAAHPLRPLAEALDLGWDHGWERLPQAPSVLDPEPPWRRGWRCAATVGAPGGAGLLILALESAALQAGDHRLVLAAPGRLHYALGAANGPRAAQLRLRLAARHPACSGRGDLVCPRLLGDETVVPLWMRRREDGRSELLLSESSGFRARLQLLLEPAAAPARIDLHGQTLRQLASGDAGWELELEGGGLALVAWTDQGP